MMDREMVVKMAIETVDKRLANIEDRLYAMDTLVKTLDNAIIDINDCVAREDSEDLVELGPVFYQAGGVTAAMRACMDATFSDMVAIGNAFGLKG